MVEQGDIIKIENISQKALVVSKDPYNESGHVIVCPIVSGSPETAFSFPISEEERVLCDNSRQLDLTARGYTVLNHLSLANLIQVIDRLQSLLDYY